MRSRALNVQYLALQEDEAKWAIMFPVLAGKFTSLLSLSLWKQINFTATQNKSQRR